METLTLKLVQTVLAVCLRLRKSKRTKIVSSPRWGPRYGQEVPVLDFDGTFDECVIVPCVYLGSVDKKFRPTYFVYVRPVCHIEPRHLCRIPHWVISLPKSERERERKLRDSGSSSLNFNGLFSSSTISEETVYSIGSCLKKDSANATEGVEVLRLWVSLILVDVAPMSMWDFSFPHLLIPLRVSRDPTSLRPLPVSPRELGFRCHYFWTSTRKSKYPSWHCRSSVLYSKRPERRLRTNHDFVPPQPHPLTPLLHLLFRSGQ